MRRAASLSPPAAARGKAPDAAPYRSLGKNYINAPAFNALRRGIKKSAEAYRPRAVDTRYNPYPN